MTLDSKKRTKILRAIKKLVLAHHINVAGIDYGAWTEHVDQRTAELLTSDVASFKEGRSSASRRTQNQPYSFLPFASHGIIAAAYD